MDDYERLQHDTEDNTYIEMMLMVDDLYPETKKVKFSETYTLYTLTKDPTGIYYYKHEIKPLEMKANVNNSRFIREVGIEHNGFNEMSCGWCLLVLFFTVALFVSLVVCVRHVLMIEIESQIERNEGEMSIFGYKL